jgi:hypothetical protein
MARASCSANAALGVTQAAREKRATMLARTAIMTGLLAQDPAAHCVLWHDLEDERELIEQAVPAAVSVMGSQAVEVRAERIQMFARGMIQYLSTKPILAGAGTNLQPHCAWAIFVGVGFKFRDFIQAVHRIQRFGQRRPVRIDVIYGESEREVKDILVRKWARYEELMQRMREIIKRYGLSQLEMAQTLRRSIGVERIEASGVGWKAILNDTVEECAAMADDSVDLIVTSIPFSNQYEYTPSYNDFGHTESDPQFFQQLEFLTRQLLRVLRPGRTCCIHVKDRIRFGAQNGTGRPTVSPFTAKTMLHFMERGFDYLGKHVVETDVVFENNQSYRLGYGIMLEDASRMGAGLAEEVLILAKPQTDRSAGWSDKRVGKDPADYSLARWQIDAACHWRSSGDRIPTPEEIIALGPAVLKRALAQRSRGTVYDHEALVRIGEALEVRGVLPTTYSILHPEGCTDQVWTDILPAPARPRGAVDPLLQRARRDGARPLRRDHDRALRRPEAGAQGHRRGAEPDLLDGWLRPPAGHRTAGLQLDHLRRDRCPGRDGEGGVTDRLEIGDLVEAIDDADGELVVGGLYTVALVEERAAGTRHWRRFFGVMLPFGERCGSVQNLDVSEVPPDPPWIYCACSFRKVRRPRSEFIAELLKAPVSAGGAA